jgi:type II secretory pathway component PulJ
MTLDDYSTAENALEARRCQVACHADDGPHALQSVLADFVRDLCQQGGPKVKIA